MVNFMLKTMKDIEVKHPVSNNLHDRIIKNLATSSVKVERKPPPHCQDPTIGYTINT